MKSTRFALGPKCLSKRNPTRYRAEYSSLCGKCASRFIYTELNYLCTTQMILIVMRISPQDTLYITLAQRVFPKFSIGSNFEEFKQKKEFRKWVYRLQNGREIYWLSIYVCWLAIFPFKKLSFLPFQTVYWIHSMLAVKFWISLRELFALLLTKTNFFCHWTRRRVEV